MSNREEFEAEWVKIIGEMPKAIRFSDDEGGYIIAYDSLKNEPNTRIKNVSAIIAMSEGISENSKKKIKRFFGKQPVSRYSNVENGILAQQSIDGSDEFEINWASYHIEILDVKNNEVLTYGKPGRIVITDLFNYAMPMIRYDTGDIGIMDYSKDGKRLVLKSVEGRKMDMVFDMLRQYNIRTNIGAFKVFKLALTKCRCTTSYTTDIFNLVVIEFG
jgi:hypothetical protein